MRCGTEGGGEGGEESEGRKDFSISIASLLLQLFQLSMDLDQSGRDPEPITGLYLEPKKLENDNLKYYIVVATPRWGRTL